MKFEVVKPEVKIEQPGKPTVPQLPEEGWGRWILDNIVAVIIAGVIVAYIVYKYVRSQS